jgi:hypothetical protein
LGNPLGAGDSGTPLLAPFPLPGYLDLPDKWISLDRHLSGNGVNQELGPSARGTLHRRSSRMSGNVSVRKLITSPTVSGVLIGLLTLVGVIVVETWFPWIDQALRGHNGLITAIWFTVALFAICVYRLWSWRRRNWFAFWAPICTLFLLHVLGVLLYTKFVRPILVWQWSILLVSEVFLIVFLVDWSTKRFRHLGQGRREDKS